MKLPLTTLSALTVTVFAAALLLGAAVPASAAALAPAFIHMKGIVETSSSPLLKVHSAMHSNCANHHGSYHKHVLVRMRRCVEWAATGSTEGPTRRICTRWVYLPSHSPPGYKSVRCSR